MIHEGFRWFKKGCCQLQVLHEVLVNRLVKLAQAKSVVRWTECPNMTIAVDRDVKHQNLLTNILTRETKYLDCKKVIIFLSINFNIQRTISLELALADRCE